VKRTSVGWMNCSIARSLEVIGEWWTPLVLREVFFGRRRFEEILQVLGISRNILTDRLATLVEHEVLERVPYQEAPVRHEYRLTEKGLDLFPVLVALQNWGDRWESPAGPPVVLVHRDCDHELGATLTCATCGGEIRARDVRPETGPGWPIPSS
jgi:DNA-binding HxlR family transcriptional regulator